MDASEFPCICFHGCEPTETERRLAALTGFSEEFVHGFMDLWEKTCEEVLDEQWQARG